MNQIQTETILSLESHNVILLAGPGCGKSYLIQEAAKAYPTKNILVITYNRALCDELLIKMKSYKNVMVHTFHTLCGMLFSTRVENDHHMDEQLSDTSEVMTLQFNMIIVDEAQDIRPMYAKVLKICAKACDKQHLSFFLLGDPKQGLYDFLQADSRYLLHAESFLGDVSHMPWRTIHLPITYRCSWNISHIVNVIFGQERLVPHKISQGKDDINVEIHILDIYSDDLIKLVLKTVSMNEDMLILLPSCKPRNKPALEIVRSLVQQQIHVQVNGKDRFGIGGEIDTDVVRVFTHCSSKGLESAVVVCVCTDNVFDPSINSHYVALTRAKEKLIIIQHNNGTTHTHISEFLSNPRVHKHMTYHCRAKPATTLSTKRTCNVKDIVDVCSFLDVRTINATLDQSTWKVKYIDEGDEDLTWLEGRAVLLALKGGPTSTYANKIIKCVSNLRARFDKTCYLSTEIQKYLEVKQLNKDPSACLDLAFVEEFAIGFPDCLMYAKTMQKNINIHRMNKLYDKLVKLMPAGQSAKHEFTKHHVKCNPFYIDDTTMIHINDTDDKNIILTGLIMAEMAEVENLYAINIRSGSIFQASGDIQDGLLSTLLEAKEKSMIYRDDETFMFDLHAIANTTL